MATEYAPETKAAVMAALLAGQSVSSVAKEYSIPKGTVSGWKQKAANIAAGVVPDTTQKDEIGELLLDYLRTSLKSLKAQAEHFGNKSWLTTQEADQLAVLHGVQTDKAIRLLEALTSADGRAADLS